MWNYVLAVPLIAHGLANIAGCVAAWTNNASGFSERPWLLSNGVTLHTGVGRTFGLLWLMSTLGLVGAGLGLVMHQEWWRAMAVAASVVSAAVILPWWRTVPPGARIGGIFDLVVIFVLLSPLGEQLAQTVR